MTCTTTHYVARVSDDAALRAGRELCLRLDERRRLLIINAQQETGSSCAGGVLVLRPGTGVRGSQ